jgi:Flp pilus assembly protein TadD
MPTADELFEEAENLRQQGKLDQALEKFQELVAQQPDHALAHATLAVALGKAGRHEDAITHAQRVCELEPRDPFSFTALSVTLQRAYAGTGDVRYIPLAEEAMARSRILQSGG